MTGWTALVTASASRHVALERARADTQTIDSVSDAKGERELLLARAFAHPRDAHIKFVEDIHAYYVHGRRVPLSVSGLYGRFFSHFDAKAVLAANMEKCVQLHPILRYY